MAYNIELIKRLRILTITLLPVEVDPAVINEPTSMVITSQVISAYRAAAGDFVEAVSPPESHSIALGGCISNICVLSPSFHTVFFVQEHDS